MSRTRTKRKHKSKIIQFKKKKVTNTFEEKKISLYLV